jgi:hypothetical protein
VIHSINDMIADPSCQTECVLDAYTEKGWQRRRAWVRAVPLPFYGGILDRLRDAWAVLRGKAYAVRWPQPGELEIALEGAREAGRT